MATKTVVTLTCDMERDCSEPVAMIDNSGFIYCENHGLRRRPGKPCRKLRPYELNRLLAGKQIKSY